ncbi:MAG: hypothetical protein JW748_13085 [Anaerolineales bacterium]|nr:hypothetical protein [Anaerolineales bacterium]
MERIVFGFAALLMLGACAVTATPSKIAPSQTAPTTNALAATPSSEPSPTETSTVPAAAEFPR